MKFGQVKRVNPDDYFAQADEAEKVRRLQAEMETTPPGMPALPLAGFVNLMSLMQGHERASDRFTMSARNGRPSMTATRAELMIRLSDGRLFSREAPDVEFVVARINDSLLTLGTLNNLLQLARTYARWEPDPLPIRGVQGVQGPGTSQEFRDRISDALGIGGARQDFPPVHDLGNAARAEGHSHSHSFFSPPHQAWSYAVSASSIPEEWRAELARLIERREIQGVDQDVFFATLRTILYSIDRRQVNEQ